MSNMNINGVCIMYEGAADMLEKVREPVYMYSVLPGLGSPAAVRLDTDFLGFYLYTSSY
jgi:hypothetical protein